MKKQTIQYVKQLMETEDQQIAKLHKIVQESLEEESLLSSRLQEDSKQKAPTYGERVADKVATFGGSWTFIISFGVVLLCWITLNSLILAGKAFDPFPYILLNLVLSCIAAMQAPVIMMSQNRKETKDRERAENDYLINLKSEIEIRHLHQKIDLSIVDQYRHLCDIQQKQLEILTELQGKMDEMAKKMKE
jgi:uncharacterized membrane protein